MSRTGFVIRVRISEMFAPYSTDSSVGSTETQICEGRIASGVYLEDQYSTNQENIGVAGRMNCEVKGIKRPVTYAATMRSLPITPGEPIYDRFAIAKAASARYCPSLRHVNGCFCNLRIEILGSSVNSSLLIAAKRGPASH
jgi:hypothetical protein